MRSQCQPQGISLISQSVNLLYGILAAKVNRRLLASCRQPRVSAMHKSQSDYSRKTHPVISTNSGAPHRTVVGSCIYHFWSRLGI